MLLVFYGVAHDIALLKARGVPTTAQVSDLHIETRRGSGAHYAVRYRFQPPPATEGRPQSYSGEGYVNERQYRLLHIGQSVPILFVPAHPASSRLDIEGSVQTTDPYELMPLAIAAFSLFFVVFLLLMSVVLFCYFKEKRLVQWGHVAPATILKQEEIGGIPPSMTVTYQFIDGQGRTLFGIQKDMPSVKRLDWPGFREFKRSVMENPVALYDPRNGKKNMLYRVGFFVALLP